MRKMNITNNVFKFFELIAMTLFFSKISDMLFFFLNFYMKRLEFYINIKKSQGFFWAWLV